MIRLDEPERISYDKLVQTSSSHSVTTIPIIIPCEKGKTPDGRANFADTFVDEENPSGRNTRRVIFWSVRIVKDDDLKNLRRSLSASEALFLADCLVLKKAYNSKDRLALQRPYERLFPFLVGKEHWDKNKFDEIPEKRRLAEIFALTMVDQGRQGIVNCLPKLVSKALDDVRLVLWWFQKGGEVLTPAIFCPDLKTAIFVKGLLEEIRCCPRCEKLFIPKNSKVEYCSPAHRDAHRMARWRQQKETKRATKKKKRRKSDDLQERKNVLV